MANKVLQAKRLKNFRLLRAQGRYIPPEGVIETKDEGVVREYNDTYYELVYTKTRNYVALTRDGENPRVRLYYKPHIFIVYEDLAKKIAKISRHYPTIKAAKFAYLNDLVGWVDTQDPSP